MVLRLLFIALATPVFKFQPWRDTLTWIQGLIWSRCNPLRYKVREID